MIIRVAIIEDEIEISESLSQLINADKSFECKYIYLNAEEAIQKIPNLELDVVLTDVNLPGKSGIDCILELKPKCPSVSFLICTSFEDSETIFNALKAGATGYITKTTPGQKLLDAIYDVYNGGSPMSSHIARKVVASFQQSDAIHELQKLTVREKEILLLLSKGFRYKEIAEKLFLSTETVRTHIRNIYEKLEVNSRTDALNKVFNSKKYN